ncbi:MAG: TrbI/VirB10 family protein [Syntrophobacteraceae bacterium]
MEKPKVREGVGDMNTVLQNAPNLPWVKATSAAQSQKAGPPDLSGKTSGTVPERVRKKPLGDPNASLGTAKLTPEQKQEEQYERRVRELREDALESAVTAPTSISMASSIGNGAPVSQPQASPAKGPNGVDLDALKSALGRLQGAGAGDMNGQNEKVAFMNRGKSMGYLLHKREAPLSPYEIKTGTIIPAVMISGINSDLPGLIVGQVSQNVYDTATGRYLLIPQGARLVGEYDSHVSYGQERVLVVWRRIVFPDASTINLETMPGTDEAGYAGFHDQVDHHYWRIFGQALLISAFTAGIELSQPQQSSVLGYPSTSQQITQSLGQQMGELGMQMVQRNMNIQPTVKIRPGYRFTVLVNKDIILQPYARMAASGQE